MKKIVGIVVFLLVAAHMYGQVTISNVYVSASTATTATIQWTTNVPSTSQVAYGYDISLPYNSPVNPNLVTAHTVTLTVLNASRPYDFAAISRDATGHSTQSTTEKFALCGTPFVPVAGTVNNYYEYGTFTMTWVPPTGSGATPTICGQSMSTTATGSLSGGASFSASVADSYKVIPGPGTWNIVVADAGDIAPVSINYPVSATSNDVSAPLQEAASEAGLVVVLANTINRTCFPSFVCAGGPGGGVTSINSVPGAFSFTGSGVNCVGTACTFTGGTSVIASPQNQICTFQLVGTNAICQGTSALTVDLSGAIRPTAINPAIDQTLRFQEEEYGSLGYTHISPPNDGVGVQGSPQGNIYHEIHYVSPGWSYGVSGCPLYCPQAGYSAVSQWLSVGSNYDRIFFNGAGIHQSAGRQSYGYGIGDGAYGHGYNYSWCAGGYQAPSDEGCYMEGATHGYSAPDATGTVSVISDPNHLTVANGGLSWGQGRFIHDTTAPVFADASVSRVFNPGDNGNPYGTIVLNNITLPVSYAMGTVVGNCAVPTQDKTTASATCTVAVTSGTFDTVSPVCIAEAQAAAFDFGVRVTNATALSGGQQTLTMNLHKSVGATTPWIWQGGVCGMVIDLLADHGNWGSNNELIHGSVYPLFGSLDAHTAVYFSYNASQAATGIPAPEGSQFRTEGLSGSSNVAVDGRFGGAVQVTNAQRVGGTFTATAASSALSGIPRSIDALNNAREYTVSGCSDPTLNGLESALITLSGTSATTVSFAQTGSDSGVCPNATLTPNTTLVNIDYGAELYNVTDPAVDVPGSGVTPATAVDGVLETSFQPNFVVGHTMDSPPHYALSYGGQALYIGMGAPTRNNFGYNVTFTNLSAIGGGTAFLANVNGVPQTFSGFGGNEAANTVLGSNSGPWLNGFVMASAPAHGGSVISTGMSPNGPTGMKNYFIWKLANGQSQLQYDEPSSSLSLDLGGNLVSIESPTLLHSIAPHELFNAILDSDSSARVTAPTTQFHDCGAFNGTNTVCYGTYQPNAYPIATVVGGAGPTTYIYQMLVHYSYGDEWGPLNALGSAMGPTTLTTSNYISLACTNLPSGTTATIYFDNGGVSYFSIGNCANSSSVVLDQGTRGTPLSGTSASLSAPFYAGAFMASPTGAFTFLTGRFGAGWAAPTAMISQPSAGTFSFDTTAKGNGLGTVEAAQFLKGGVPINSPLTASFTTTAVASEAVPITGMTATGHCTFSPTNAVAGTMIQNATPAFISAKAAGSVTFSHVATAGATFDFVCSAN